jgi:hydrogenase/urease accessory protein HupE
MQEFNLYFGLGVEHILSWSALDHILFVSALCLRYQFGDWRKVAILVTAFTIGHSITLALSVFGIIKLAVAWIEFAIPLTIAATALNNLMARPAPSGSRLPVIYFFALFFGMIHGLAYANLLLDLEGSESLPSHLLAFNLGIEVAQLLVVAVVLTLSFIFVHYFTIPQRWWLWVLSGLILVFSLKMALERLPDLHTHSQTAITNEKSTFSLPGSMRRIGLCPEPAEQSRLQSREQV